MSFLSPLPRLFPQNYRNWENLVNAAVGSNRIPVVEGALSVMEMLKDGASIKETEAFFKTLDPTLQDDILGIVFGYYPQGPDLFEAIYPFTTPEVQASIAAQRQKNEYLSLDNDELYL